MDDEIGMVVVMKIRSKITNNQTDFEKLLWMGFHDTQEFIQEQLAKENSEKI